MSGESECLVELKRWTLQKLTQNLKFFFKYKVTVICVKCPATIIIVL